MFFGEVGGLAFGWVGFGVGRWVLTGKSAVGGKLFHVEQLKLENNGVFSIFWRLSLWVAPVQTTVAVVCFTVEFHRDGDRRLQGIHRVC